MFLVFVQDDSCCCFIKKKIHNVLVWRIKSILK